MLPLIRLMLPLSGLMGASGVATAALASHGDGRNVSAMATILLAHAPVLLAVSLFGRGRVLVGATAVLALGTLMFAADLAMREWLGQALFPGAAPLGGAAMILGWLGLAAAGLRERIQD